MFIKSADIYNYRGIEKLNVEFREGINLLIGDNGTGKTSLLNALAMILQEPLKFIAGLQINQFGSDDVFQTATLAGSVTINRAYHYPIEIESTLCWQDEIYNHRVEKKNELTMSDSIEDEMATLFRKKMDNLSSLPIVCFLPAQRGKLQRTKSDEVKLSAGRPQRSQAYWDALNGKQNLEAIQRWCVQMEFAEYQKKSKIREYASFQSIVSRFASLMDGKAIDPKVYYSSDQASLVYFDGKEEKALHLLSDGYQAALCMAIELAYRAALLNPMMDDISQNIEGVVLIDEPEMHLHPEWQWKILDAFENTFPKVQFIVATHSPIILSSAKNATLLLMKSPNEVVELDNAYGYRIDDVLSIPQGSISQPAAVSRYYDRIEEIIEGGHKEDLEKILEEAREEFRNSPEVYAGIKGFAEVNQWVEDA